MYFLCATKKMIGKKIRKIILITLGSLVLLIAGVLFSLTLSPVQQWAKDIIVNELTSKIGSNMHIGHIELRFINSLNLKDVYIEDLSGDTLLYTEKINTKFNLLPLLRNKLEIKKVELIDFVANVTQDSVDAPMNFQFIVDAFASSDTTETEPSQLRINLENIILENGKLGYHIKSEPLTPDTFNVSHIDITNFRTKIALDFSSLEKFKLNIQELSFHEKSGIDISQLMLKATGSGKNMTIDDLQIKLPNSSLQANGKVDYQNAELEEIAEKGVVFLQINQSSIVLADLKAFSPTLATFKDPFQIESEIEGELPAIRVNKFVFSFNKASLNANASVSDYANIEKAKIQLTINDLYFNEKSLNKIIENATGEKMELPEQVKNLGNASIQGKASGTLNKLDVSLNLESNPGNLALAGKVGYFLNSGNANFNIFLKTNDFRLSRVMNDSIFGLVSLDVSAIGDYTNERLTADILADIPRFDYDTLSITNTSAHALIDNDKYNINLNMDNEIGSLALNADADLSSPKQMLINANLSAKRLTLWRFVELQEYPGSKLSFALNANIAGNDLNDITGSVLLDSLFIQSGKQNFSSSQLKLMAGFEENGNRLFQLNHEFLSATISGKMAFDVLADQLTGTMNSYFPALMPLERKLKKTTNKNDFNLQLVINNTEKLTKSFDLPFTIIDKTRLNFSYNDIDDQIRATLNCPTSKAGEMPLKNLNLSLSNDNGPIRIAFSGELPDDSIRINLNGTAENNQIALNTRFDNHSDTLRIQGNLVNRILLERNSIKELLKTTIAFEESQLKYNTLQLSILPSDIVMFNEKININNVKIIHKEHPNEYIAANGVYSTSRQDTLKIQFNKLDIKDITEAVNMGEYELGGLINGNIVLAGNENIPTIFANPLNITGISLKKEEIGDLNMRSVWNNDRNIVLLNGTLTRKDGARNSTIRGRLRPASDSLSININLNDIKLAWIQPFMEGTLNNLGGNINTDLTVSGTLGSPKISGLAYVDQAKFGIDFTNVTYSINDSIRISPTQIDIKDLKITDKNGNSANLNCTVKHNDFKNLTYNISARMRDFLILNTMAQKDSLFYGLVKLSGNITGDGTDKGVGVNMKLQNSNDSKIAVILPSNLTAQEHQNFIFVDHRSEEEKEAERKEKEAAREAIFPVDLKIGMTVSPQMEFTVFLDPSMRNRASVTGTGNIDFAYNLATSKMSLFGNYTIDRGSFLLSLQNIAQKKFQIAEGSVVNFVGDPLKTSFDVAAIYSLKADLTTLDQSFASDPNLQSSTRVDVNCILKVKGNLDKMNITYDIELPNAQQDVQQNVRAYMNNEDILIKEFAYLLAVGAFYAPDFASAAKSNNSIVSSLASSTLSSTLNNLIGGILGNNISINTNIGSLDNSNIDVDLTLSSSWFNNRLIVNTNFEYSNSNTNTQNSAFGFGDFDAELKLNQTGSLRLRAFNKTNDEYYQKAPMTQGLGFVYTKEAADFKQLFKSKKRRNRRDNQRENK